MREETSGTNTSFLDRPIAPNSKLTWWTIVYVVLIAFIVCTRFWDLGARSYCHDESIHAWESWKLATGQPYIHSPVYHGPFGYHVTALIFVLFGDNDVTGRIPALLFGIGITLLVPSLRKWLGASGVLMVTLLAAISPVMMHRSRFFRHDQFALFFNLLLFIAILRYLDQRKTRDLYLGVAALSFGYTTKETTFITYAIFGSFLAGLFLWRWLQDRRRPWTDFAEFDLLIMIGSLSLPLASPFAIQFLGHNPVDYSPNAIVFSGIVFAIVLAIGAAIGMWWDWRRWLVCAGIFYAIFVPLFTTMFTNGNGFATGMVGSLGYWLSQHGVQRGGQPWYYYLVLMPLYEFLPLLLGLGGTAYFALREEAQKPREAEYAPGRPIPFVAFLIYYTWASLVIYSWAGEKMPWLTMQLAVPLHLLAGWALSKLIYLNWQEVRAKGGLWLLLLVPLFLFTLISLLGQRPSGGTTTQELGRTMAWLATLLVGVILAVALWRRLRPLDSKTALRLSALSIVLVLMAATVRFAWMATYINADIATEFLVYAQGTPDNPIVAREVEQMSRRLYGDLSMKVAYDDESSWPMVWYLRDFSNAQFYGKTPGGPFDAEVVIVGPGNEAGVKPLLGNRYYRRQYRLIWWPNQDWYANWTPRKLWQDLIHKETRQKYWQVIWNRKYDASLTAWPYVHNFAMYVRRDVVQQLWDYGPEAMLATGSLPGDDYAEKWKQLPALTAWGNPGNQPGQLSAPKGLALDAQGNLYVADSQNHRIQVFDASGRFLRQWGNEGSAPGQFKEPWGIAVGANGQVYVADTWNHRIQVFDAQGAFLRTWGIFGDSGQASGPGNLLYGPRDITVDAQGHLYVADTGNKRVIKFDAQGAMLGAVGGSGDAEGQMQEPVGIAIGRDGLVYVVDTWNRRIQVFDSELRFVRAWPVFAWEGMSVVNKPYLAIDAQGTLYATDPEGYRVLQFDSQGKLLSAWGQYGADLSAMNLPTGIKIDAIGRLLVADSGNNRILVFAPPAPSS